MELIFVKYLSSNFLCFCITLLFFYIPYAANLKLVLESLDKSGISPKENTSFGYMFLSLSTNHKFDIWFISLPTKEKYLKHERVKKLTKRIKLCRALMGVILLISIILGLIFLANS